MNDGRRKGSFRDKESFGPRMRKCSSISVCTKDKSINYVVPSVFALPSEDYFRIRRNLRVKNLVQTVDRVNLYAPKLTKAEHKFPSSVRRVMTSLIPQLRRHPKNHFNSKELALLLQVYYTITEYRVRHMTQAEFDDFLRGTLGITNYHVLSGLKRISAQSNHPYLGKELSGVSPTNFLIMLSIYLRGSLEERAEMAFEIMDIDRDGLLKKDYEFPRLLSGSFKVSIAAIYPEIDPDQPIRDSIKYLEKVFNLYYDRGVDLKSFKEVALQQPWIIDSLLPVTCQDVNKLSLLYSLSV
ncbi:unnamed protein product [Rodentolepis nana]|uniref:EF-hand domain-containing protein n=1 Tax=Rodentolepis nana TaxID=102285 RepID=A0A0R3TEH6_RODNA|nr:unnamed protein product [Rodentolepis nana]